MENIREYVEGICRAAKESAPSLAGLSTQKKNKALLAVADALIAECDAIVESNKEDLANAEANGIQTAMLDRLMLNRARIEQIASSINDVVMLADPIGNGDRWVRPNGLEITRIRVPLGVVAIIYEARPNVTVDAAALCLKTGNAVVLRGGKEAICTNKKLIAVMKKALSENGIDGNVLGFIADTSREGSAALMQMRGLVDVLIPRGGRGLIKSIVENADVPVIETGAGNCHMYIDASADIGMALDCALNAKLSRPAVCNAIETLLVHRDAAAEFLPKFKAASEKYKLDIRGDEAAQKIISCNAATEADYATEFDDYIIAVKIVSDINEAIEHIRRYSTGHSEAIITKSLDNAELFKKSIDAAAVYVNASTRFTDGGEFGFGAEIGISTQKLHARGPMGLTELTTVKYTVDGNGQIR